MNDFEKQKKIADKLSNMLPLNSERESSEAEDLLGKLYFKQTPKLDAAQYSIDQYPDGHIGIYRPENIDSEIVYQRDTNYIDKWTFFADTPTIKQKKEKKRVVVLGESVARGFLLEPEYTPAMLLSKLLKANCSDEEFDIIDLAESNISMRNLKKRLLESMDLKPDLVVIMAGNNWYMDYQEEIKLNKEIANELAQNLKKIDHLGELKPKLEKIIEGLSIDFMSFVGQQMKEHNFSAVMAIPEYNLLDCRSTPGERKATYLPGNGMRIWAEARERAKQGKKQGDLLSVAEAARKMIDVDPSHPLGYEILADVKIDQQDYDNARELLELGRDTAIFLRSNSKPRTLQITRRTIKEFAPTVGISVIDLPEVYKEYLNGKIPGKNLFLDYCHFSVEGMQVAMEPIAGEILRITNNQNTKSLKASSIKASKQTIALGYLFGAMHNEHWGQSYELHKHHCQKALEASKDITKIMVYYCDMMSRNISNGLTKSLEKIAEGNLQVDRYGSAFMHPKNMKYMEIDLVNAMVDTVRKTGVNLTRLIKELRKKEHGIENRMVDLLTPFYHATSYDEVQGESHAFLQLKDSISNFFVISGDKVETNMTISFRVPNVDKVIGHVEFWYNGEKVGEILPKSQWTNFELFIPAHLSIDGINNLSIHWPVPENVEKPHRELSKKELSLFSSMYYVFGEVSHLKAAGLRKTIYAEQQDESVV